MKGFNEKRIVAFESRLRDVMEKNIEKFGGKPFVAPSMQEIPLENNVEALNFAEMLFAGKIDILILMTGVGFKMLLKSLSMRYDQEKMLKALDNIVIVARGPKPVSALREVGLKADITVPEPNTWVELLDTLSNSTSLDLKGKTIAVQEYGITNKRLISGLKQTGAYVVQVPIYRWSLPNDIEPLKAAVKLIADKSADLVLFTTGIQIQHAIKVASAEGIEKEFMAGLLASHIASIGPTCSEALKECGLRVDFEPSHPKLGHLVSEAAKYMEKDMKTAEDYEKPFTLKTQSQGGAAEKQLRAQSPMMQVCRGEVPHRTPVWLMRQAGRYMKEYRDIRNRMTFLELCKDKDLCAEVTVHAQEKIGADAAIIFSDLLVIVEPFGLGLEYVRGDGPQISGELRNRASIEKLKKVEPRESLSYVADAIRLTRQSLKPEIPLIGFTGCPFTLASYMIEGGASRNFKNTKQLMYSDTAAWHLLMEKITDALIPYAQMQAEAGADIMQFFDSWVGCLGPADYKKYVFPHSQRLIQSIQGRLPVIHFGTGTGSFLDMMYEAGGDVLGVDFRTELNQVWDQLGAHVSLQGNMDPLLLQNSWEAIEERAAYILDQAAGHPHIFNLGHGILPETPVENVIRLVDFVHSYSSQKNRKTSV